MMRFQGNFKIAVIAAVGIMLLAAIAGAAVFGLTTLRDTTEDTPVSVVGETAGAAAGPVVAVGQAAPGSPIEPASAEASEAPSPPSSVTGTRSTDGSQIAASWSAAANATHYNLNFTYDNGTNWHRHATDISGTSATITGALRTEGYILSVQSVKKVGNQSYAWGWKDSGLIAGAPPVVASVTGVRSENGKEIALSWSAVAEATHYNVNYTNDGGTSWHRYKSDISSASTTLKMTELEAQKAHTVAVQSVRQVGEVKVGYGWRNSAIVHAPPSKPRDMSRTKNWNGSKLTSITVYWTIPEFAGTGSNTAGNKIGYNISCYVNGSWTAVETGKTFTPTSNDPAKYKYDLTPWQCLQADAIAGIAATNVVTGEAETLSLP